VGFECVYVAEVPTHAVLVVEPRLDGQVLAIDETWFTEPKLGLSRYVDAFGNSCRRTTLPAERSTVRYDALVEVPATADRERLDAAEVRPQDLPDEALVYTLPSRFCPSDELADVAWSLFASVPPGWGRVQAICDWVHNEVRFGYGSSTPMTTAADVYQSRRGVCRDFAHLAVALCRALNIPARYVFGYLPDIGVPPVDEPMDFCAWMEVFLEGSWWTFDPRNNQRRVGRVLVARGRDALDVAMISTFGGPKLQSMTVWADEVSP
jgi:transglutaminase-like putative cysteine protease